MKQRVLFLCIFSLLLASCDLSPNETAPESAIRSATMVSTMNPPDTPVPSSTPESPTASPTATTFTLPTATIEPAATQPPIETFAFPALTIHQPVTITHITMISPTNGWAIGHQSSSGDRILLTQDGGHTWQERTPPLLTSAEQTPDSFTVWGYFQDTQTAWVISIPQNESPPLSAPIVWRTQNGGQTWESSDPLALSGGEAYFVPENFFFLDQQQGWLLVHVGAGMSHDYSNLYVTYDGGIHWQRIVDPYGEGIQSLRNTGFAFADALFGWVTKDNLAVMPGTFFEQTSDGGLTWEDIFIPSPSEIDWFKEMIQCGTLSPVFSQWGSAFVLVNCHTFDERSYHFVYHTKDRGKTWQPVQLPTSAQSLLFIDDQTGWAFGRDLYQSTDGGLSWVKIKTVNWDGQFSFVDEQTGWAVARTDSAIALVFTQDGGKTWQQLSPTVQ